MPISDQDPCAPSPLVEQRRQSLDVVTSSRGAYRVEGSDRRQRQMRVEIDRRSGEVLSVR